MCLSSLFYFISVSEMNNTEGAIAAFPSLHFGTPKCFIVLDTEKNQSEANEACYSLINAMCHYYANGYFMPDMGFPYIASSDDLLGVS